MGGRPGANSGIGASARHRTRLKSESNGTYDYIQYTVGGKSEGLGEKKQSRKDNNHIHTENKHRAENQRTPEVTELQKHATS